MNPGSCLSYERHERPRRWRIDYYAGWSIFLVLPSTVVCYTNEQEGPKAKNLSAAFLLLRSADYGGELAEQV